MDVTRSQFTLRNQLRMNISPASFLAGGFFVCALELKSRQGILFDYQTRNSISPLPVFMNGPGMFFLEGRSSPK